MIEFFKIIGILVGTFIMIGFCLALLIVLVITAVFSVGYLYDTIFGDSLYRLGIYLAEKYPKIRKCKILIKIKRAIEPREQFVRYETPLCTYCFSYSALSIIFALLEVAGFRYGGIF